MTTPIWIVSYLLAIAILIIIRLIHRIGGQSKNIRCLISNADIQQLHINRRDAIISRLQAEVKRLSGWQDATAKNSSELSRFKMKATPYMDEYIIMDNVKYLIREGVMFERNGFVPFDKLEVFGK